CPYGDSIDQYVAGTVGRAAIAVTDGERHGPGLIHRIIRNAAGDVVGVIQKAGPDKPCNTCINLVTATLHPIFRLVPRPGCSDINESTPGVCSRRDSVDNHVFLCPERCGRSGLRRKVNSEKRPSTNPNETISPVSESIDVHIRRRTRVDWSAGGGDKFADCPQYTSARGRAATGSGRIDRHERVEVVINCIENSGSGADKVVVV